MSETNQEENRLLTFWLPALGIGIAVAALAGVFAYFFLLPYADQGGSSIIWHKKAPKAAAVSTTTDQLNTDLKAVDTKLNSLDSATKATDSSINDQPVNLN